MQKDSLKLSCLSWSIFSWYLYVVIGHEISVLINVYFLCRTNEYNWFYCNSIRVPSNIVKLCNHKKRSLHFKSIRINYMIVNIHHLLVNGAHCIKMHFLKLLGWRFWKEFRWSIRTYCRILSNIRILHLMYDHTSVGVIGVVICLEEN